MIINKLNKEQIEELFDNIKKEARIKAREDYEVRTALARDIKKLIKNLNAVSDVVSEYDLNLEELEDEDYIGDRTNYYINKETWRYDFKKNPTSYKDDFVLKYSRNLDRICEDDNIIYVNDCNLGLPYNRVYTIELAQIFAFINRHSNLSLPIKIRDFDTPLQMGKEYDLGNVVFSVDVQGRRVVIRVKEENNEF